MNKSIFFNKFQAVCLFGIMGYFVQCASTTPYKLSEAVPKYAKYEGKAIDPLLENPISKPETGIEKYDNFFARAKSLIIKLHLAKKLTELDSNREFPEKSELIADLVVELPQIAIEIKAISEEAKNLTSSVQADFIGSNVMKLPSVVSELAITTKELAELSIQIPVIITNLAGMTGGTDLGRESMVQNDSNLNMRNGDLSSNKILPVNKENEILEQEINFPKTLSSGYKFTGSVESHKRLNRNRKTLEVFGSYLDRKLHVLGE